MTYFQKSVEIIWKLWNLQYPKKKIIFLVSKMLYIRQFSLGLNDFSCRRFIFCRIFYISGAVRMSLDIHCIIPICC